MKGEVVAGAGVVGVGAAFAGRAHGGAADAGQEARRLRVAVKRGLLLAAARADESARGVSAAQFFVVGRGDGAGDGAGEAKAGFREEACARGGAG